LGLAAIYKGKILTVKLNMTCYEKQSYETFVL
jgi:hypothetical protein